MRYFLALPLILAFASVALSQTPPSFRWNKDDPRCDRIYVDGDEFLVFKDNGLNVAAQVGKYDSYFVIEVFVANTTQDKRFDVLPQNAVVLVWTKKGDDNYQLFQNVPPEKIASKVARRAKWGAALRAFAAGMATTTSEESTTEQGTVTAIGSGGTATGVYSGSSSTTTTTQNQELQRQVAARNKRSAGAARSTGASINASALHATTLFPGRDAGGMIFFPRKKGHMAMFSFEVGGTRYQFSFAPE